MAKPRRKQVSYPPQVIKAASNQVLKSLNGLNRRSHSLAQNNNLIANSLGKVSKDISKSSLRRQKRNLKQNLAGRSMQNLMETLPDLPSGPEDLKPAMPAPTNPHKSRKAQHRVEQREMRLFKSSHTSLASIRDKLLQQSIDSISPAEPQ